MPRGRKKVKKTPTASKPGTTRKTVRPVTSPKGHKEVSKDTKPAPSPAPKRVTRSGLRSRPSTHLQTRPVEVSLQAQLRTERRERREAKAEAKAEAEAAAAAAPEIQEIPEEHYPRAQTGGLAQSIEAALAGVSRRVDDNTADNEVSEAEENRSVSQDIEKQEFNQSWGYLPPLDDEAVAIIEAIIENPEMATSLTRIGPTHPDFSRGLKVRNVFLVESDQSDPYADEIRLLKPPEPIEETNAEIESQSRLWVLDQEKLKRGSNEALFQRTLMMNLIGRHLFIYQLHNEKPDCLDFSVEEPWTCWPMPTRSYYQSGRFLSQPKPDLAVFFYRERVIPENVWNSIPFATQNLACYENTSSPGIDRIFHFLTVEAKKVGVSADNEVGKFQSLNNASQALHNMFEFFREAGPEHANTFFAKVRFFSVVASPEGLRIRIHRATQEPGDGSGRGFIMPHRRDYPLRFEYENFAHITNVESARASVLKIFENILVGYGAGILCGLIQEAAKAIVEKLEGDHEAFRKRGNPNFYRYDQIELKPSSRMMTPMPSRPASVAMGESNQDFPQDMSFEMRQSGTSTPVQSQPPMPTQTTRGKGKKRLKSPSPSKTSTSRQERKRRNERSFSSTMSV